MAKSRSLQQSVRFALATATAAAGVSALHAQEAGRLREAAHKFCGLLSAFSTVAGNLASDLEDQAMSGQLDYPRPLVARLETMVRELLRQVDRLSLETLKQQAQAAKADGLPVEPDV